jgi:hypothetical protein
MPPRDLLPRAALSAPSTFAPPSATELTPSTSDSLHEASADGVDQRTPLDNQGELMVSRALYQGALHHQSLSGEDAERYAERLHDAIEEAGSTFPAPGPGVAPAPRTLQSPTRQRKPRQKKLHNAVKKRGMTGAELAEKAAKKPKSATGCDHWAISRGCATHKYRW